MNESENYNLTFLGDAVKRTLLVTCRFYLIKDGKKELPEPNGCGVLLEYNNKYYCLSNAHVLADEKFGKTFILSQEGEKVILGGSTYFTRLPASGSRYDDTLDVAIVQLTDNSIEKLKQIGYSFLNIEEIRTGYSLTKNDAVFIIGYPGNRTKIDIQNKNVIAEPFLSRTIPFLTDLSQIGFPSALHHIVKYSRNILLDSQAKQTKIGPKPHGISGSGVWLINQTTDSNYNHTLIGIFSEYFENRALLVGTKVDIFIDLIRQKFDSTIPNYGIQIDLGIT